MAGSRRAGDVQYSGQPTADRLPTTEASGGSAAAGDHRSRTVRKQHASAASIRSRSRVKGTPAEWLALGGLGTFNTPASRRPTACPRPRLAAARQQRLITGLGLVASNTHPSPVLGSDPDSRAPPQNGWLSAGWGRSTLRPADGRRPAHDRGLRRPGSSGGSQVSDRSQATRIRRRYSEPIQSERHHRRMPGSRRAGDVQYFGQPTADGLPTTEASGGPAAADDRRSRIGRKQYASAVRSRAGPERTAPSQNGSMGTSKLSRLSCFRSVNAAFGFLTLRGSAPHGTPF
jgi:hypothetical protein